MLLDEEVRRKSFAGLLFFWPALYLRFQFFKFSFGFYRRFIAPAGRPSRPAFLIPGFLPSPLGYFFFSCVYPEAWRSRSSGFWFLCKSFAFGYCTLNLTCVLLANQNLPSFMTEQNLYTRTEVALAFGVSEQTLRNNAGAVFPEGLPKDFTKAQVVNLARFLAQPVSGRAAKIVEAAEAILSALQGGAKLPAIQPNGAQPSSDRGATRVALDRSLGAQAPPKAQAPAPVRQKPKSAEAKSAGDLPFPLGWLLTRSRPDLVNYCSLGFGAFGLVRYAGWPGAFVAVILALVVTWVQDNAKKAATVATARRGAGIVFGFLELILAVVHFVTLYDVLTLSVHLPARFKSDQVILVSSVVLAFALAVFSWWAIANQISRTIDDADESRRLAFEEEQRATAERRDRIAAELLANKMFEAQQIKN
jgi:hypothetical protein